MSKYTIKVSAAKMPSSCWGRYGRVAVLEMEDGYEGEPKMISERARGVKRIVERWEKVHVGKTERDEMSSVLREAKELISKLEANG